MVVGGLKKRAKIGKKAESKKPKTKAPGANT
jgi:hypothetical protein